MDQKDVNEWWRIVQMKVKMCSEKSEIIKGGRKSGEEEIRIKTQKRGTSTQESSLSL
jgi:hypothetical protein